MPQLEIQQTPEASAVNVSAPNIITNISDDNAPRASAASFGIDLSGLTSGLHQATEGAYHAAIAQDRIQHAKDADWVSQQTIGVHEGWMQKFADARAMGQPYNADAFSGEFNKQANGLLAQAPNDRARDMMKKSLGQTGLSFYGQALNEGVSQIVKQRGVNLQNSISSINSAVSSGSISYEEGAKRIHDATLAVAPVVPDAPEIHAQGQADLVGAAVTNTAKTQGPDVAAADVRSGKYAAAGLDPTSTEKIATTLDNKAQVSQATRTSLAQQDYDAVMNRAADGKATPQEMMAAAKNLNDAKASTTINTNPPPLADLVSQVDKKWQDIKDKYTSDGSAFPAQQLAQYQKLEYADTASVVKQRLLAMPPDQMRAEIDGLQNVLPEGHPILAMADKFYKEVSNKLVAGSENYDPAAVAMMRPEINKPYLDSVHAVNAANQLPDGPQKAAAIGAAQSQLKIALQASAEVQKSWGITENNVRPLPDSQAHNMAANLNTPDNYRNLVDQLQTNYGQYADRAINQVMGKKGVVPGAVQLAMLAPKNDELWSAAKFTGQADADDAKIIKATLSNNSDWKKYVNAQQAWPNSAEKNLLLEQGINQVAAYNMAQHGMKPDEATKSAISASISNAYSFSSAGNSRTIALPKTIAANPDQVRSLLDKGNLALSVMAQNEPPNNPIFSHEALAKSYWSYSPAQKSLIRVVDNGGSQTPMTLADGQPVELDPGKLKDFEMNIKQTTKDNVKFVSRGYIIIPGEHTTTPNVDPKTLFVPRQSQPDTSSPLAPPQAPPSPVSPPTQVHAPVDAEAGPSIINDNAEVPGPQEVRPGVMQQKSQLDEKLPPGLKGLGSVFENVGSKYGIDPSLLAAISMHETGLGKSRAFLDGKNAMGVSNSVGPRNFQKVEDSIDHEAATIAHSSVYAKFRETGRLSDLADVYAPVGAENDPRGLNKDWYNGVSKFYSKLKS